MTHQLVHSHDACEWMVGYIGQVGARQLWAIYDRSKLIIPPSAIKYPKFKRHVF